MNQRFAVYFCPREATDLYRFGAWWLGRDCRSTEPGPPPDCSLGEAEWRRITQSPRQYGFHATLKPPFALRDGTTRAALVDALAVFAAAHTAFEAPPLCLVQHEGFLALTPMAESHALHALADAAVTEIDGFRRPASPAELERRRKTGLTSRQDELLTRWGYPYVLDEFRFHMTLTERLSGGDRDHVLPLLAPVVAVFAVDPLPFADICLFEQAEGSAPFILSQRFPLG